MDAYRAVVETGEPLVLNDWIYPQDVLGGEERRYDVRAVRVGDGLSQTWRDVTDRYITDQRLRSTMQEYRLLAENAADVVLRTRNGVALWVSPSSAEQLGYPPEELVGTDVTDLVHPDDRALIAAARQELVPGRASRLRYRVRTASGSWTWMQVDSIGLSTWEWRVSTDEITLDEGWTALTGHPHPRNRRSGVTSGGLCCIRTMCR